MSDPEILGESLPLDETIDVPAWPGVRSDIASYKALHAKSVTDSRAQWESLAKELDWFERWDSVVSKGAHPHVYSWFSGGTLNISQLAVDRHARSTKKDKVALIWEGEPTDQAGAPEKDPEITYGELLVEVNRFASILSRKFGLKKGDKVAVYCR